MQSDGLLRQPGQRSNGRSVGEHGRQPGHLGAHGAEAHDAPATGVGGGRAPDGRRVPAGEVDRGIEPGGAGVRPPGGQRDAGPGGHLGGGRVDRTELRSAGGSTRRPSAAAGARCPRRDPCCRPGGPTPRRRRRTAGRPPPPRRRRRAGRRAGRRPGTARSSPWRTGRSRRGRSARGRRRRPRPGRARAGPRSRPSAAGRRSSVCSARPTGPSRRTAGHRPDPTPFDCQCADTRLPSHSPTGSRCNAMIRSVLTNCTSVGSAWRLNALPQSANGQIRWNGDGSSSGSSGTVRIQTVVGPWPGPSPGG